MPRLPPAKKRRLSPPQGRETTPNFSLSEDEAEEISINDFSERAAHWDLEQKYEQRSRLKKEVEVNLRLPIKTADGRIQQVASIQPEDGFSDLSQPSDEDVAAKQSADSDEDSEAKLPIGEQLKRAKEELARVASLINEEPEEHVAGLRTLAHITASRNATITKLGLATQLAVYKDIIPGYRIRPVAEEEMKSKLSKEVRKLRNYEQGIVGGYQKYVKDLTRISNLKASPSSEDNSGLVTVAVSCACNLLNAVPHFNFRDELLKILITKISGRVVTREFGICIASLKKLFEEDEEGNASLEATSILAKMVKARRYNVHEEALNTLLHLRLLSEFAHKGSNQRIDKEDEEIRPVGKALKVKKEFRTKKQRKIAKERKEIEKEMKDADATVSFEQRDQMQAETLKLVFGIYFHILKVRTPKLMGPVLEGLVKYAHLINQDFFGDLLEALKELVIESDFAAEEKESDEQDEELDDASSEESPSRNVTRESLLCVITAFALLQGQDASKAATTLHLDLDFFISHLYRTLYAAAMNADVEFGAKSARLQDPDAPRGSDSSSTKVDVQTSIVLLIRSLQAVLLPTNTRSVPPNRLAAYSKQILTSSLHLPEKSCTAMIGIINQVLRIHKKKIGALWNTEERRGDGFFDPFKAEVEGSNPFASTVWEGELLRLHYAPSVREGVKAMEGLLVHD